MNFKEITADQLQINPFTKIGSEWMLITAGDKDVYKRQTFLNFRLNVHHCLMRPPTSARLQYLSANTMAIPAIVVGGVGVRGHMWRRIISCSFLLILKYKIALFMAVLGWVKP